MSNFGKYKERNAKFQVAGKAYPINPMGVGKTIEMPSSNEISTYETDYCVDKPLRRTEICALGLNKHRTRVYELTHGPYLCFGDSKEGKLIHKIPLGRSLIKDMPEDYSRDKVFGMEIKRGFTTAETIKAQGEINNKLRCQAPLGKSRTGALGNKVLDGKIFGIATPSDPYGSLMWELFSKVYGEEEDEERFY